MNNKTAPSSFEEIRRTVVDEIGWTLAQVSCEEFDALVREILDASRVFVAGAGRTGLAMKGYAMRLAQLGLRVHVVGETTTPAIGPGDLLLIGSGSGVTERLVHYAGKASGAGARVAVATADAGSPAARLADRVVVIPAPTPKSANETRDEGPGSHQPMGTLFEQSLGVMLDASVMPLMTQLKETGSGMFARHANLE